ncbi:hypothetical protein GSI_02954 [Ganoderma sinense ZZ0214-1]|uniref:RRM domain-containing protein n=1 Tax=Ganoderma sinense ZZ0214-1 TaxID=1077348 RepID=A0A2G8SN17_9APHY|nr:hypothetical protein GSI_02954 [Ganoderma sinense ZZ0214-1]
MSANIIHVSDISATTTTTHLNDFFTFCGKINDIGYDEEKRTAKITFDKPSAAKTALMLHGGTLDGAHLSIVSDLPEAHAGPEAKETEHHPGAHIDQSDKPRAGSESVSSPTPPYSRGGHLNRALCKVAAEYLAKGYTLSDQILQRAIELDQQHGISGRFLTYIQGLDTTLGAKVLGPEQTISGKAQETFRGAQQQARAVDEQRGISKTATDYYTKALASPFGQKVKAFYTTTSKQVLDIHEEARRIHETHKTSQGQPQSQHPAAAPSSTAPAGDVPKAADAPTTA